MASTGRGAKDSVSKLLYSEPYRFSFVQAIRLLQQSAADQTTNNAHIGGDALPTQECVQVGGVSARSFAASEVVSLSEAVSRNNDLTAPVLSVAFMGLYGQSGVLPYHDTQRIIDSGIKDNVERDFLDVFNHRMLSLFYRASVKYRIPVAYESGYAATGEDSKSEGKGAAITRALFSLVGLGTDGLLDRLEFKDELAIEFSGAFSQQPKNAVSLEKMLRCVFQLQIELQQFVGQWLSLSQENQSEMPCPSKPLGQHCQLGSSFILGERVWDIAGKFRLRLGPLDRAQFTSFLPGSKNLVRLAQIVRLYAGIQLDFDIQLELAAEEVPQVQLGENSRLGLETWLITETPSENKLDTVFTHSGFPEAGSVRDAA